MSYQVQQCWRTFSHLTSECFFWTLRKWKSVKDWHRRNELALRRCARLKSWNSKLAVRFARKWSSDTELWHWPLCDEPVHGWQKKTKKVEWISDSNIWPTKLRMIHPHHFPERNYGLGHGQQPTQVQKWRARSAQGCTGAAYMQFERYRNGSPMVSLERVKWLGHVPIPSHHAG